MTEMTVFIILIKREYQNEYKFQILYHDKFLDKCCSILKNPIILHIIPIDFSYYHVTTGGQKAQLAQIFAYGPNL